MMGVYPEVVIAGCGNPLFADDGFGPAVIELLKKFMLPGNVKAVDAGLGGPYFVFTLLDPNVTKKLIIIDVVDFGADPGSIAVFKAEDMLLDSICDLQPGGVASSLQRIEKYIDVIIIGCQPKQIPYPMMKIALSHEVQRALPKAIRIILNLVGVDYRNICKFYNYFVNMDL